ncbi:MAG: MBL fold metallo-hydrolase [Bacteroidales bacterium]|nr:MBL fold metallo-hydrolase [Bacteroidales bacterium]
MKRTLLFVALMITSMMNAVQAEDVFTTKNGKRVEFVAVKHASIRIIYDDKEIEIDPVTKLPPVTDYATFPKADYIFVTHEHFDHCDAEAVKALSKEETVVVANANSAKILGLGEVMQNGDKKQLAPDITVEAVPAYNTSEGKTQFHPKGRDNGYILSLDGLRIYIAGDTEDIPEMAQVKDIDVAFMPCNQPFTMLPQQLAKAAAMVKPKVLFPYHLSETSVDEICAQLKGLAIDTRIRSYK